MKLTVTCALFDPNEQSRIPERSRVYSPKWVDILWRMLDRNLTTEWRLVCLTHYPQSHFQERVEAVPFLEDTREVSCLNEVFRPDIKVERGLFMGLDSVIVRNIDHMAAYQGRFALAKVPRKGFLVTYENPIAIYSAETANHLWENRHQMTEDPYIRCETFGLSETRYWSKYAPSDTEDIHTLWPREVVPWDALVSEEIRANHASQGTPKDLRESARIIFFCATNERQPDDPINATKPHNSDIDLVRQHWK